MITPKIGPLTPADFQKIWESTTDPSYWRSFEQAGEGNGFEAHTQAWQQGARVSQAVDVTTQAMFLLPWSGQSNPPASGPQNATVTLTFSRSKNLDKLMVLSAGTWVEEQETDWGTNGGVAVLTGRRYSLDEDLVFFPGVAGPLTVTATAERPGTNYNDPLPGTLSVVQQPGTEYTNRLASVRVNLPAADPQAIATAFVDCANDPDTFIPDHVGQYIQFTAGVNSGAFARIIGYAGPNLSASPPTGGTVQIELSQVGAAQPGNFGGAFAPGDFLLIGIDTFPMNPVGYGRAIAQGLDGLGNNVLYWQVLSGVYSTASVSNSYVTDQNYYAAANWWFNDVPLWAGEYTAESGTATWRILDWVLDWGLSVTNEESPSDGAYGMLDTLGRERGIGRASASEGDDTYRERVAKVTDVVSPNAIRRALNRLLVPLNIPWVFEEAGTTFPGFYFDEDAYDYDLQGLSFASAPSFVADEPISQTDGTTGWVASGFAAVRYAQAPVVPGPPGAATFVGVVRPKGTFTTGGPVVGKRSGYSATPTTIAAGLPAGTIDKVIFGYENMRAWYYVIVPPSDAGDVGFAYDSGPENAYDNSGTFFDFYDGLPIGYSPTLLALYQSMLNVRAGGVGVDILMGTASAHDPTATTAVG